MNKECFIPPIFVFVNLFDYCINISFKLNIFKTYAIRDTFN